MGRFTSFVILAAMRTGSNFLEESLNAVEGLQCHGEAFNPAFIGYPNRTDLLGVIREARDADPDQLLQRMRAAPGLNGFRYFPGHDPRILSKLMADPACAKVILARNPAESYVSLLIARETGQWKLGNLRRRREAKVTFDSTGFRDHLDELAAFYAEVRRALQVSGQSAFSLDYSELGEAEVLQGLLSFLGVAAEAAAPARTILPQNPEPLADKVTNPAEMATALAALDPFALAHLPGFEARRGPQVPLLMAARQAPLLYLPIAGGPAQAVESWFADLGGAETGFNQTTARDWMRARPGHRRFTVLRHPLLRAFAAFEHYLSDAFDADLRKAIGQPHGIARDGTAAAFTAFLGFLKANLNGQTPHRTQPHWASQYATLQGFAQFAPPDLVAREDRLAEDLGALAQSLGCTSPVPAPDPAADRLRALLLPEHEKLARQIYARDYLFFGFDAWA